MNPTLSRPYVLMNMAMSIDGKISTRKREQITLGSINDRRLMDVLRAQVDAVIVGAGTVRNDGYPLIVREGEIRKRRINKGLPPHPINIILSRSLEIPTQREIFKHREIPKILFTTRSAGDIKRKRFERLSEVVVIPHNPHFLRNVLSNLAGRGIKRVLLEGGGEVNFSFFNDGLVDEVYLTVTPRIIGGSRAPTVVDGKGFLKHSHIRLTLRSTKRIGNELFLRYLVRNKRP